MVLAELLPGEVAVFSESRGGRSGHCPQRWPSIIFAAARPCHETDWLDGLRGENRQKGLKRFIGFAVSAPMVAPLKAEIAQLDESAWQLYHEDAEAVLEGAAVPCYSQEIRAPASPAVALRGDSRAPEARRFVCRRRRGQALRRSDEFAGLETKTFTGMASPEAGLDRSAARRAQKRVGGGGLPPPARPANGGPAELPFLFFRLRPGGTALVLGPSQGALSEPEDTIRPPPAKSRCVLRTD